MCVAFRPDALPSSCVAFSFDVDADWRRRRPAVGGGDSRWPRVVVVSAVFRIDPFFSCIDHCQRSKVGVNRPNTQSLPALLDPTF